MCPFHHGDENISAKKRCCRQLNNVTIIGQRKIKVGGKMRKIVCIGDSLTYGFGAYSDDAWPYRAQQRLGITCINRGENGETTSEMNLRFYEDVILQKPDMAVILGGSNDLILGQSPEYAFENIEAMADKALRTGIVPAVGTPLNIDREEVSKHWFLYRSAEETYERFIRLADMIREFCAQKEFLCIDFQKEYPRRMMQKGIKQMYIDGTHPVREGYHAMADIFCDAVSVYIKR